MYFYYFLLDTALAAEKMVIALQKIVNIELRRGWSAWLLEMKQEERKEKYYSFLRFFGMRYLSKKILKFYILIMKKKWKIWFDLTKIEILRRKGISATKIKKFVQNTQFRSKLKYLKSNKKYFELRYAIIFLQKIFRGKVIYWKFKKEKLNKLQIRGSLMIQKNYRSYLAMKKIKILKKRNYLNCQATIIQNFVRSYQAKKEIILRRLRLWKFKNCVIIQSNFRKFLMRMRATRKCFQLHLFTTCAIIQKYIRRRAAKVKFIKMQKDYFSLKNKQKLCATQIQKIYRGFRSRIRIYILQGGFRRNQSKIHSNATIINTKCRYFLAHLKVKEMRKKRFIEWIKEAREWEEVWSEDDQMHFYSNSKTGENAKLMFLHIFSLPFLSYLP